MRIVEWEMRYIVWEIVIVFFRKSLRHEKAIHASLMKIFYIQDNEWLTVSSILIVDSNFSFTKIAKPEILKAFMKAPSNFDIIESFERSFSIQPREYQILSWIKINDKEFLIIFTEVHVYRTRENSLFRKTDCQIFPLIIMLLLAKRFFL